MKPEMKKNENKNNDTSTESVEPKDQTTSETKELKTSTCAHKAPSREVIKDEKRNPKTSQAESVLDRASTSRGDLTEKRTTTNQFPTMEECQLEIQRLSLLLATMRKTEGTEESPVLPAVMSNASAIQIHARMQEANLKTYNALRGIASKVGPQPSITPTKIEKAPEFGSPLKIKVLSTIPSLFKVKTVPMEEMKNRMTDNPVNAVQPRYLDASRSGFKFGLTEVSFVMESEGLPNEIKFTPNASSVMFKDVRGDGTGPVNLEASRTDYVFLIFETLFKMYLDAQFILSDVPFKTQFDREVFAGDLVSMGGMLRNQFVDQNVPLLPAAGYGHAAPYLLEKLKLLFNEQHHGMQIGELARDTLSARKVFRRAGVVTDQYIARMNELYLDYLFARSIDHTSYVMQHRALTLPNVSIKIDKPSVFANSLIPVWKRSESDGCLLLYALDVKRQHKYLLHLTELLSSVGLLSFATVDEISQLPPRRSLRDAEIQQLLDTALTSVNENEVFKAIGLDLSTTWIDTTIIMRGLSTTPLDAVFKVFTIVLWFCYFPSISRDNVPRLMFELFSAMEELASEETARYVRQQGFSNYNGRNASIQEYPKELYLNETITYPLLLQAPPNRFRLFRQLHELLMANHGEVQNTVDNNSINTPRMSDVRRYYQPYHSLAAVSNAPVHGENPNDFGNRLKDLHHFMKQLIEEYKRKYRDYSNRSAFGNSTTSISQLLGYFDAYNPALLYSIGIRGHAELFALRQLGANSPYVIDCQNFLSNDYRLRPQVLFQLDNGDWSAIMMQRYQDELPFELPLFMFLTLRGAKSIEAIMPPDASVQFQNLMRIQEEGILCGDVIRFVNNIKFGTVGVFNREALGISTVITAARADKIFSKLSEISSLNEFKDLFSVLINDVAQRIDSRAVNFRIVLQPYLSSMYDRRVSQPIESLYGVDLRLGRELMDAIMTVASPLFVPETSPISLYTTGLAVKHTISAELDPFAYIDIREAGQNAERIVMYSPELLTRRIRDGARFIDEDVLKLPNADGEYDFYQLGTPMPFTVIIVNTNTGPVSTIDYQKLVRFLKERKIMFYFPELMLIMNRELVGQEAEEELLLEPQLRDVLTGLPSRRLTLTFGDTVSKPYRLANSPEKLKFIYPTNAINQRQIVLKGMSDPIQPPPELQIGTWMSWAYGGTNGKTIIVRDGEMYRDRNGDDVVNDDGAEQVIDKLELGFVNMNNEMRILTMPEYLTTPQIEQDAARAYVGRYTTA